MIAQKYTHFHISVMGNIGISFKWFKLQLIVTAYAHRTRENNAEYLTTRAVWRT